MTDDHALPVLHDAYGFRIDCTQPELEARHHCDLAQKQIAAKWDKMQGKQDRSEAIKDAKLKKYCRMVRAARWCASFGCVATNQLSLADTCDASQVQLGARCFCAARAEPLYSQCDHFE